MYLEIYAQDPSVLVYKLFLRVQYKKSKNDDWIIMEINLNMIINDIFGSVYIGGVMRFDWFFGQPFKNPGHSIWMVM